MNDLMKKWMKTARKYGAVFDNVAFVYEDDSFAVRSLYTKRESVFYVPYPVLLPESEMEITDNLHRVKKSYLIDDELRALLDGYLNYILSDDRVDAFGRLIDGFHSLPGELIEELNPFGIQLLLEKSKSRSDLKHRLIQARTIKMGEKRILMPFIDFMNHDALNGTEYSVLEDAVGFKGRAADDGQLYAQYNRMTDPFGFLRTYHFVPQAENAMSAMLSVVLDDQTTLRVNLNPISLKITKEGLCEQEVSVSNGEIRLAVLWLGSSMAPRNPYLSFAALWEGKLKRKDTQRVYSIIKSLNIVKLVKILRICDKAESSSAITMVKEAALQQLSLIGQSYEDLSGQTFE